MSEQSFSLLKSLAGIGPARMGVAASGPAPSAELGPGALDFAQLLGKAQNGTADTKLPVTVSSRLNLELTAEQLARVGVAADRAQAAGLQSAVVLIDGKALQLDVQTRQITGTVAPGSQALTHLDGIVAAPGPDGTDDAEHADQPVLPVPSNNAWRLTPPSAHSDHAVPQLI